MKFPRIGTIVLFVLLTVAPSFSQDVGAVPSGPADGTAAAAKDPNALPWKFVAGPVGVLGQDWEAKIGAFGTSAWDCDKNRNCAVEQLIQATVGVSLAQAKSAYVVIHVADYGAADGTKMPDAWYLYRSMNSSYGEPKWTVAKFNGLRIYGASSVLFLFVHLHARAASMGEAKRALSDAIKSAKASSRLDDPVAASMAQAPDDFSDAQVEKALRQGSLAFPDPKDRQKMVALPLREKDTGEQLKWLGNFGVPSEFANVHYEAAVVKRTPANVANFLSILKILGLATGSTKSIAIATNPDAIVWGAGKIENIGLPSDVSIAGYNKGADEVLTDDDRPKFQIGSVGAYNDEQLYWWDASIGIPVHKLRDLQYSSSDNTVVATQVDKQSAYAMFNLMVHPVDLSDPKSNLWPRILVGFPLASNPWDQLFAGGAIGLPLKPFRNFQFFAGATFNRTRQPATLTAGETATDAQLQNDLRIHTTPKLTFGINVPVKSVLDKLLR